MVRRIAVVIVLLLTSVIFQAKEKPAAEAVFADVTSRGRALYEYDQAAWHATDAVQAAKPNVEFIKRYVAQKTDTGWHVAFGKLSERRDKFLLAYEAVQGATLKDFTVRKLDPPREETSFYLIGAKALETVQEDFKGENRPYNVAILPAEANQLYLYVMPAQTKTNVYPLGGDVRYLISANGESVVEKRQLHLSILENGLKSVPKDGTPAAGWHTHVLTNVPEDTDVFHVLTQNPPAPEFIGTKDRKIYRVEVDGTIYVSKM